jgi:hypothetical protein
MKKKKKEHTERFNYPPIAVPTSLIVLDDTTVFAANYPQQYRWLLRQDWFHITCFRWPEMLGRALHNQVGMMVCELQVEVRSDIAKQFAAIKSAAESD